MKKIFLALLLPLLAFNCSSDDDSSTEDVIIIDDGVPVVRISTVNTSTDEVTLTNLGDASIDVGSYWLCLGPGTYMQIDNGVTGSTTIAPNGNLTVAYDVNPSSGGLGVFSTNTFSSSDPEVLVDYVQWGGENQARVAQAVTAGRWDNVANFVSGGSPFTFNGEAEEIGSTFWSGTAMAVLRISTVNTSTDEVTLTNLGDASIDVGSYWLCLGPGTYMQINNGVTGSTTIAPNGNLTVAYNVNPSNGGLGVFSTNTFSSSDPEVLVDYVQWGGENQARVAQAVTAGRWDNAANFVSGGSPFTFNGEAEEIGSTFWSGIAMAVLRISTVNTSTDEVTLTNLGNASIDVGSYWLCLGPGTYMRINNGVTGSTTIAPNGSLTVAYNVNPSNGGLGVFSTNTFGSSDPEVLVDYVQWGGENQARVAQAVTAGRWDSASGFVQPATMFTFNGQANDFGVAFW